MRVDGVRGVPLGNPVTSHSLTQTPGPSDPYSTPFRTRNLAPAPPTPCSTPSIWTRISILRPYGGSRTGILAHSYLLDYYRTHAYLTFIKIYGIIKWVVKMRPHTSSSWSVRTLFYYHFSFRLTVLLDDFYILKNFSDEGDFSIGSDMRISSGNQVEICGAYRNPQTSKILLDYLKSGLFSWF